MPLAPLGRVPMGPISWRSMLSGGLQHSASVGAAGELPGPLRSIAGYPPGPVAR